MRLSTSNLGAVIVAGLGIMGIYLITKPKTPNTPSPQTSSPDSSNLENDMVGEGGNLNRDQSAFIETLWLKQLANENAFIDDFAEIKHYHRGYAGPRLAQLVNSESPAYQKRPLKVGERIAYWVMEYIPTIGKGEMTEARIRGAKNRIEKWGDSHGYTIHDLHEANFGMRKDGSFVAFDPWPTKN